MKILQQISYARMNLSGKCDKKRRVNQLPSIEMQFNYGHSASVQVDRIPKKTPFTRTHIRTLPIESIK